KLPCIASMHTRFETYPRYYGLAFLEPLVIALLRRFYRRCDAVVAPSESMAQVLREQRMGFDIGIWTRGIERSVFNPGQRDMAWRRAQGFADDDVVIGYFGRLVMEKGLDVFAESVDRLRRDGVKHKILVIGEGPARDWFAARIPDAVFTGFLMGPELGRAVAGMDVLLNPSTTEAFGNVTNEVMACGVPVVAARATGSSDLVHEGFTGYLIAPGAIHDMADALARYCTDPNLRARHGAASQEAASRYDWDAVNQALVDKYLRVVAAHERGLGPPRLGPIP
ncbi:MAG: glycosyltransferase, partial [Alphaproteobacteria bacterium]|nr:glycosyltransferase [Alphaproteobacteria bacterium]